MTPPLYVSVSLKTTLMKTVICTFYAKKTLLLLCEHLIPDIFFFCIRYSNL